MDKSNLIGRISNNSAIISNHFKLSLNLSFSGSVVSLLSVLVLQGHLSEQRFICEMESQQVAWMAHSNTFS